MTHTENDTTLFHEESDVGDDAGGAIGTVANQRVTGSVISTMADGWIKLPRSIVETWMYRNPDYLKIWVHLLIAANYRPSTAYVGGHLTTIERGEVLTSIRSLAQATGATEKQVRTFLNLGQKSGIIRAKKGTGATVVSIIDYDTLQGRPDEQGHTKGTRRAHQGHYHKKEEGRKKKEEEDTITYEEGTHSRARPRSPDEVTTYFAELGSTDTEAATFWDHFTSNGWRVGGKATMKDWRATARNWVRRNNKPKRGTTYGRQSTGDRRLEAGTAESLRRLIELERPGGRQRRIPMALAEGDGSPLGAGTAHDHPRAHPELPFRRTDGDGL